MVKLKSIFIFLMAGWGCNAALAQKISKVSSSVLTGISLPPNTNWDQRLLIESAGKAQLKYEGDKYNATLSKIEILKTETPIIEDSIKTRIASAGWQIYPAVSKKYYWAIKNNQTIMIYLSANKKNTDLYFCEAKSTNGYPLNVISLPVNNIGNNDVFNNQNNNTGGSIASTSFITCGNIMFTVPEGWKLEAVEENYLLRLPEKNNDPDRWVNLLVCKGTTSSGNIDVDFNNAWQKNLGSFTKYTEPYLVKDRTAKGYDIVKGGTNVRQGNAMPVYAYLWQAKIKDRAETVIAFANNNNDFDISIEGLIKPFYARLQFKNLPQAAVENYTFKGNGIQGIYVGLQNRMNLQAGISRDISFLIVYNDGKLKTANTLPESGFNNFDRVVDREINADYWGEYNLNNRTVVFNEGNRKRLVDFAYNSPFIVYNDHKFTKLPSVDGLSLAGTYTADKTQAALDAYGHEPTMSFYSGGRFEDNTAMYYVKSYDAIFKNPGRGKYRINNFTIDMIYDDGRGSASFPFITLDASNNASIQIGQHIMLKK